MSQLYRNVVPRAITVDVEYAKGDFKNMYIELEIDLINIPAHSHECNGRIESENCAVRSFYNRLRACYPNAPTQPLLAEATFAKKTCAWADRLHPHLNYCTFDRLYLLAMTCQHA